MEKTKKIIKNKKNHVGKHCSNSHVGKVKVEFSTSSILKNIQQR
jgi:hypothetical protein